MKGMKQAKHCTSLLISFGTKCYYKGRSHLRTVLYFTVWVMKTAPNDTCNLLYFCVYLRIFIYAGTCLFTDLNFFKRIEPHMAL